MRLLSLRDSFLKLLSVSVENQACCTINVVSALCSLKREKGDHHMLYIE